MSFYIKYLKLHVKQAAVKRSMFGGFLKCQSSTVHITYFSSPISCELAWEIYIQLGVRQNSQLFIVGPTSTHANVIFIKCSNYIFEDPHDVSL